MKIIFESYAKYNKEVNLDLLKLIEPLPKEKIMQKTKAYYPSIFDTMLHIFFADLNWVKRFKGIFAGSKSLDNSELVLFENDELKKKLESDYTLLFSFRRELDETIIEFIEELEENSMISIIKYKTIRDNTVENELWKNLLQWFNHQAHHRGQVSVLLDMVDVFNDYSSILAKI